jgi:hypothetical protein
MEISRFRFNAEIGGNVVDFSLNAFSIYLPFALGIGVRRTTSVVD